MPIGSRAARARPLGIRRFFRPEVKYHLEPDEWPELATYRNCLPQTELTYRLIVLVPYICRCAGTNSAVCCLGPFLVPIRLIVSPLAGAVTSGGNLCLMRLSDFGDISCTQSSEVNGDLGILNVTLVLDDGGGNFSRRDREIFDQSSSKDESYLLFAL